MRGALRASVLAALLLGCDGNGDTDTDTDSAPASAWTTLRDDLPGAVLSVWGTSADDVWLATATGGSGTNALHWDGSTWTELDTGVSTDLWWVYGPDADTVMFAGADGVLLSHDRASGAFTPIPTPTGATYFGTWGTATTQYAVGGFVPVTAGAPSLLRVQGGVASEVTDLPPDLDPEELWFKVWGSADDDVWVIGDHGTVLHYDGASWSRQLLPGAPRLVTINGGGADDVVVVGSTVGGAIYELGASGTWEDASPASSNPLNGVFVTAGGDAAAAGFASEVLRRDSAGWRRLPPPSVLADWHAVWIDPEGRVYVGGGDLMLLTAGALLRYDPAAEEAR